MAASGAMPGAVPNPAFDPYRAARTTEGPQGSFMLITAPAKINLYLGVHEGVDDEGYHRVDTIMTTQKSTRLNSSHRI